MLVDFKFKNYLSYLEETELTLKANIDSQYKGINSFSTKRGELLKSILIFGANGSGKSNFIDALEFVCDLILSELDIQSKKIGYINYFGFYKSASSIPTLFEITFIASKNCYIYGFEILNKKINKEYLYKKNQRQTEIFYRSSPNWRDIRVNSDFENVRHLMQNTREDALFLSWANFGNNDVAMEIYSWFENVNIFNANDESRLLTQTVKYIEENGKDNLLEFFKKMDISIEDFEYEIKEEPSFWEENLKKSALNKIGKFPKRTLIDLKTKHAFYDDNWLEDDFIAFPFSLESDGTKKIFELSGVLLEAIEKSEVVIIDEIDTKLHPMLVNYIIRMFNSEQNKKAQIICATHNTSLLDEEIRRDQLCVVSKNEYGISKLAKISDFKGVRKNGKMAKMYLQGCFGGIPKIE